MQGKKVNILFVVAIIGVIIEGCGAESSAETAQIESISEIRIEEENKEELGELVVVNERAQDDAHAAYKKLLLNFCNSYELPEVGKIDPIETRNNMANNNFAVNDVDCDGVDELIIYYIDTAVAGMCGFIYDYDAETEACYLKFEEFPSFSFYENGVIEVGWSHNQGWAGDFWPYTLYTYDYVTDSYLNVGSIDAFDRELYEMNKDNIPLAFPYELDKDGNGFVYFILEEMQQYQDPSVLVDDDEYDEWLEQYTEGTKKIEISFLSIKEENILGIK